MGGATSKQKTKLNQQKLNQQLFESVKTEANNESDLLRVHSHVVKLVDEGAEVSARDHNGKTPLHYARNKEIVNYLLNKNAELEARDEKDGRTPLHDAHNEKITKCLLDAGANASRSDKEGYTPLHYAKNAVVARHLIDAGAFVNATTNKNQYTPLHLTKDTETAKVLIMNGADLQARFINPYLDKEHPRYSGTALDLAVYRFNAGVVFEIIKNLPLESMEKEKPACLNFERNVKFSEYWDFVKECKKQEYILAVNNSELKEELDKTLIHSSADAVIHQEEASTSQDVKALDIVQQKSYTPPLPRGLKKPLFSKIEEEEKIKEKEESNSVQSIIQKEAFMFKYEKASNVQQKSTTPPLPRLFHSNLFSETKTTDEKKDEGENKIKVMLRN